MCNPITYMDVVYIIKGKQSKRCFINKVIIKIQKQIFHRHKLSASIKSNLSISTHIVES